MVRRLDAALARIWTLDAGGAVLELQASSGLYAHLDGRHARVPVGRYKIGLIADEREPHVTNNVQEDERVHDKEWARREGLVSFAGYPLVAEGRLVGVVAMFSREALGQDTIQALESIAPTVTQGVERKQAEEVLRETQRELAHLNRVMTVGELSSLIIRDGDRASQFISRLRALLKKSPSAKSILDVGELVREVIALTRHEVTRNKVILRTDLDDAVESPVSDEFVVSHVNIQIDIDERIQALRGVGRQHNLPLHGPGPADAVQDDVAHVLDLAHLPPRRPVVTRQRPQPGERPINPADCPAQAGVR